MGHEQALSPKEFRALWEAKPVLRAVYRDYYARIAHWCRPGVTLEIGAGSGNLGDELPGILSSDIVPAPWLDVVADAQRLPVTDSSIATLVGVDVLHHIEYPRHFLAEARRALQPGGRIVLVEPAITPISWLVFKLGHPEPVHLSVDPLADGEPDPAKHPFDSNQALPTLLAGRHRHRLESELGLNVVNVERLSLVAYPLSGGFRSWSLMPARAVDRVLRAERRLERHLGRVMGFRLLLVIERPCGGERGIAAAAT
jgi:SAM-dependent methyltransferase